MLDLQRLKRGTVGLGSTVLALSGHLALAILGGLILAFWTVASLVWAVYGVRLTLDLAGRLDEWLRVKWHLPSYKDSPHQRPPGSQP
jgi:hypothetical protein